MEVLGDLGVNASMYAAWCEEFTPFVEWNEPRMLALNIYESEDHTSSVVVQVHPDAESMEHRAGYRAPADLLLTIKKAVARV